MEETPGLYLRRGEAVNVRNTSQKRGRVKDYEFGDEKLNAKGEDMKKTTRKRRRRKGGVKRIERDCKIHTLGCYEGIEKLNAKKTMEDRRETDKQRGETQSHPLFGHCASIL